MKLKIFEIEKNLIRIGERFINLFPSLRHASKKVKVKNGNVCSFWHLCLFTSNNQNGGRFSVKQQLTMYSQRLEWSSVFDPPLLQCTINQVAYKYVLSLLYTKLNRSSRITQIEELLLSVFLMNELLYEKMWIHGI